MQQPNASRIWKPSFASKGQRPWCVSAVFLANLHAHSQMWLFLWMYLNMSHSEVLMYCIDLLRGWSWCVYMLWWTIMILCSFVTSQHFLFSNSAKKRLIDCSIFKPHILSFSRGSQSAKTLDYITLQCHGIHCASCKFIPLINSN